MYNSIYLSESVPEQLVDFESLKYFVYIPPLCVTVLITQYLFHYLLFLSLVVTNPLDAGPEDY